MDQRRLPIRNPDVPAKYEIGDIGPTDSNSRIFNIFFLCVEHILNKNFV